MTATQAPWTTRLVSGSRAVLAAGLGAALVTVATSFWLARDDGRQAYEVAPAGATARIGGATFHLDGLSDVGVLAGSDKARQPVAGATFVVADLTADLTGLAEDGSCLIYLKAGDYWWLNDAAYSPAEPAVAGCQEGLDGTIEVAFEVPERLVGQVDGVRVDVATGAGLVSTLLPGTLG